MRVRTTLAMATGIVAVIALSACTSARSTAAASADSSGSNCSTNSILTQVKGMDSSARTAKLTQLAAKEPKSIQVYSTLSDDEMNAIISAFKQKYGVSIKVADSNSEEMVQRLQTEQQAGKTQADFIENDGTQLQLASSEGLLAHVSTPYSDGLPSQVVFPTWVGHQYNVFTVLRNPKLVPDSEAPKTYQDLTNPKFKGLIGVDSGNWNQVSSVSQYLESHGMSESDAVAMWTKILKGVKVFNSNTQLAQAVEQGQLGLALTYNHYYTRFAKQGSRTITASPPISPQVLRANGAAIPCHASAPATALLLFDFVTSQAGQQIIGTVGNRDMTSPAVTTGLLPGTTVAKTFVNLQNVVPDSKKWVPLFNKMITS